MFLINIDYRLFVLLYHSEPMFSLKLFFVVVVAESTYEGHQDEYTGFSALVWFGIITAVIGLIAISFIIYKRIKTFSFLSVRTGE